MGMERADGISDEGQILGCVCCAFVGFLVVDFLLILGVDIFFLGRVDGGDGECHL